MREILNILFMFLCVLAVCMGGASIFFVRKMIAHATELNALIWMVVYVVICVTGLVRGILPKIKS